MTDQPTGWLNHYPRWLAPHQEAYESLKNTVGGGPRQGLVLESMVELLVAVGQLMNKNGNYGYG